jgi:hypothetical protein
MFIGVDVTKSISFIWLTFLTHANNKNRRSFEYVFMYVHPTEKSIQSSFQPAPSLLALDKKVIANIFLLNRVYANRLAATYFSRTIYSSNWSQLEITLQSQFEKILNEAFVSHYLQLITNPSLQSCKRFHVSMLNYLM